MSLELVVGTSGGLIELRPHNGVIGCPLGPARRQVHFGDPAPGRYWSSCQDVIDAPAEIAVEGISEVIPVGVLDRIGMEHAENVDEPPGDRLLVSVTRID